MDLYPPLPACPLPCACFAWLSPRVHTLLAPSLYTAQPYLLPLFTAFPSPPPSLTCVPCCPSSLHVSAGCWTKRDLDRPVPPTACCCRVTPLHHLLCIITLLLLLLLLGAVGGSPAACSPLRCCCCCWARSRGPCWVLHGEQAAAWSHVADEAHQEEFVLRHRQHIPAGQCLCGGGGGGGGGGEGTSKRQHVL
jgi:hypothetical protein